MLDDKEVPNEKPCASSSNIKKDCQTDVPKPIPCEQKLFVLNNGLNKVHTPEAEGLQIENNAATSGLEDPILEEEDSISKSALEPPKRQKHTAENTSDNPFIEPPSMVFRYITLGLLKNATSSIKKNPLSVLMTSLGLKSSSNVSANKRKLCDLLDKCETEGSSVDTTLKLISILVNKLEDTMIKFELLANDLPLGNSAQDRKKALISHCRSQCKNTYSVIQLVFRSDDPHPVVEDINYNPSGPLERTLRVDQSNPGDPTTNPITPIISTSGTADPKFDFSDSATYSAHSQEDTGRHNETVCGTCSNLKHSMAVLQESMIALKEEMLQQKAISELIITSPSTTDKKIEKLIRSKLGPIESRLEHLRSDLDTLRATVDNQNTCLENLTRMSEQTNVPPEQLRRLEAQNVSNTKRVETLEIGQVNLKNALRNFAKSQSEFDEFRAKLDHAVNEAKTTSLSNRNRITTLETAQEDIIPLITSKRCGEEHHMNKRAKSSPEDNSAINGNLIEQNIYQTGDKKEDVKPFTKVSSSNCKTHREVVNPTSRSKSWRHQSESTSSESTNKKVREDKKLYRRSTALLIHDDTFRNFDGRRFNNQFNVHTFKATGFKDLRNRSKKLQATIKRLRPDCIYVHIGSSDFMKKKSGIVGDVKELAEFLLDSTQAQICFSALVPSANNNQLNDKIELVNNDVRNYISWLHTEKPLTKNRIFTFSNNNVRGQNKHVVGSDVSFQLTERGQKMITRDTIKFLSWNINHSRDKIEGAKVDIPEIHKLFNSHDIFALQETKGVINISNYLCFNSNRKNSKSGGVCIGVHKSLTNGVINVPVTSSDDIIAIKLKACFFDLDRDTYLINVYDSPKNGAFKKRQRTTLGEDEVTTLEHLQEFLANIPINEDAILLGDFNARTATLEDMLSDNVRLNDEQLNEYFVRELPKRSNSDTKLNSNGRPFTELLQTSGLVFLNGRTLGDIFGEPTCIQRQGASTVDYICVSASLYHRVRHFRVNGISQYSDHRSLSMSISTNPLRRLSDDIALAGISDAPQAFKWVKSDNLTQDTATKFQMAQEAQLHIDRVNCLLVRPINSPSEVVQLNTDVVTLYQDLAGSVTVRKSGRRHNNKKRWFDINCRIAKRQANRADRNANNNPYSTFLREQHFLKKKEYRTIKRRKKHAFLHEMNNKINGADTINWSALKQLSANYKDEEPFDIYDLLLFQKFFSDLYNRQCCKDHPSIIDNDVRSQHSREHDLLHALNEDFTLEELTVTIKKLQNKKSVAEDLICNEMLKNSNKHLLELLQKLFNACLNHDRLNEYAETWELSVNISKTNVMVFNSSSRLLQCAHGFKLGNLDIEPVRNYCYLGIQFSLNGSFKQATEELRKKALRSYFSIRRIIDSSALTTSTLLKLIDSLVKPVATYGCPVWLPSTSLIKTIVTNTPDSRKTLPKAGAKDPLEVTHLRMLKWILGVHRRTNNNFCYGDTGRTPLAISVLPQCISYFLRASQAVDGDVNSLLHHTFRMKLKEADGISRQTIQFIGKQPLPPCSAILAYEYENVFVFVPLRQCDL
ncbi:hypothetical protein ACHWQZ_G005117 [Mnemiopsis leidyi]